MGTGLRAWPDARPAERGLTAARAVGEPALPAEGATRAPVGKGEMKWDRLPEPARAGDQDVRDHARTVWSAAPAGSRVRRTPACRLPHNPGPRRDLPDSPAAGRAREGRPVVT